MYRCGLKWNIFRFSFLFLFFLVNLGNPDERYRQITISNGTILGKKERVEGMDVWQFLGIPYAQPPVFGGRFALPRPLKTLWKGIFNATLTPDRCMQFGVNNVASMSEDCLTLNVFTPWKSNTPSNLAVMVWIHGGDYQYGEAYPTYDGTTLSALGKVVVVTINYRLNAFGFWTLDIAKMSNLALWDQQMALQWVHDNIAKFGGNPSLVTIFGSGAGGVSVSLHLLSKFSRPLFRRAIAQSGSSLAPRAVLTQTDVKKLDILVKYHKFAESLGCTDPQSILLCMKMIDGGEILTKSKNIRWRPVVDGVFLTDAPKKMMQVLPRNHEFMLGVNNEEGWWFMDSLKENLTFVTKQKVLNQYFSFSNVDNKSNHEEIINEWIGLTLNVSHDDLLRLSSKAISEAYYFCPAQIEADNYARGNKLFTYVFAHQPSFSRFISSPGATHSEEISFVFQLPSNFTTEEIKLSKSIIKEWVTFSQSGHPYSADWKPYTFGSIDNKKYIYQELALTPVQKSYFYKRHDCVFWNTVLPQIKMVEKKAMCAPKNVGITIIIGLLITFSAAILIIIGLVLWFYSPFPLFIKRQCRRQ